MKKLKLRKLQKQVERYKYGGVWQSLRNELISNPYIGIAVAIFILLSGSLIAAKINYISNDTEALIRFIISFLICLILMFIGFIYFLPFWSFKRKYSFIEKFEEGIAKKIIGVYNRSQKALTSFDGINAIQLFRLETHTDDHHIQYNFNKIFSIRSKYFNLSKLKKNEIEVPIELFGWLKKPKTPVPDYSDDVNPLILYFLDQKREEEDDYFKYLIDNWDAEFLDVPKIYSIHYHVVVDPKVPINDNEVNKDTLMDSVFLMGYRGGKSYHENRQYYSVKVHFNDPFEGTIECVLLIIANKKIINKSKIIKVLVEILLPRG